LRKEFLHTCNSSKDSTRLIYDNQGLCLTSNLQNAMPSEYFAECSPAKQAAGIAPYFLANPFLLAGSSPMSSAWLNSAPMGPLAPPFVGYPPTGANSSLRFRMYSLSSKNLGAKRCENTIQEYPLKRYWNTLINGFPILNPTHPVCTSNFTAVRSLHSCNDTGTSEKRRSTPPPLSRKRSPTCLFSLSKGFFVGATSLVLQQQLPQILHVLHTQPCSRTF